MSNEIIHYRLSSHRWEVKYIELEGVEKTIPIFKCKCGATITIEDATIILNHYTGNEIYPSVIETRIHNDPVVEIKVALNVKSL